MDEKWIRDDKNGTLLLLYIQPGASRSEVVGLHGERLKIRIKAPPVEGAANEELVNFLAKRLNLSRSKIHFLRGETSRQKDIVVELDDLSCSKRLLDDARD